MLPVRWTLITTGKRRKAVVFNETSIMSIHIIAFVVGDLKAFEFQNFRLPIRLFCTPEQDIQRAVFSAEFAARTLKCY
jgi:aminopeptidase 2